VLSDVVRSGPEGVPERVVALVVPLAGTGGRLAGPVLVGWLRWRRRVIEPLGAEELKHFGQSVFADGNVDVDSHVGLLWLAWLRSVRYYGAFIWLAAVQVY
jgi:hypothetical protein